MHDTAHVLDSLLQGRLSSSQSEWLAVARAEIAAGVSDLRFTSLLSLASRHAPRAALEPGEAGREAASAALAGWNPERWRMLDAARAALILARRDLAKESADRAIEDAFQCADEGELRALYRALPLLPKPGRFAPRMGRGCRSNMISIFEAAACDSPFPQQFFDDIAWRQLVIKAVFIEAPLWRVFGLDSRLDSELARMALDLIDERRSAGRLVQPQVWLCLGTHSGKRGLASIETELSSSDPIGRHAAILALARANENKRLATLARQTLDPETLSRIRQAQSIAPTQSDFASLLRG